MPNYTEWGSIGAIVFLTVTLTGAFIGAIWKMQQAQQAYQDKRDKEWRDFFTGLSSGNQADIADMRTTAEKLTKSLDQLLNLIMQHDTRSQAIQQAIEALKAEIGKLAGRPRPRA